MPHVDSNMYSYGKIETQCNIEVQSYRFDPTGSHVRHAVLPCDIWSDHGAKSSRSERQAI